MKWLIKKLSKLFQHEEEIIEVEEIIVDDSIEAEELHRKIEEAKLKVKNSNPEKHSLASFHVPDVEEPPVEAVRNHKPIIPIINPSTQSREVDAKISYQYPKGNFRFPVEIETGSKKPRRTGTSRNISTEPPRTVTRETKQPVKREYKNANKERDADLSEKKRPFRPTEIPSPIYGFKQRPDKQELPSNPYGGQPQDRSPLDRIGNSTLDYMDISHKIHIASAKKSVTRSPETKKMAAEQPSRLEGSEEEHEHSPRPVLNMDSAFQNESIQVEHPEEYPMEEPEAAIESLPSADWEEEEVADEAWETESAGAALLFQDEEEESGQDASAEVEHKQVQESAFFNGEPFGHEEQRPEANHNHQEYPVQEQQPQDAPSPAEPRKGKTIPFNVVMLKQDKKKLNSRPASGHNQVYQNTPVLQMMPKAEAREERLPAKESARQEEDDSYSPADTRYTLPSIDLLTPGAHAENDEDWLFEQSEILNETLLNFNVRARVVNVTQGPAVTRFEVQPEPGVKVNKVTNLTDDIKLAMAAQDIRLEAPIPGKHTIGIEIPNRKSKPVFIREVLESDAFRMNASPMAVALGLDISGEPIVTDLRKMPHGLIAGATGSGKSVCINTMLVSLLFKAAPHELKLLLIDPKMVELAPYNHIPHLVSPVITDVKAATAALKWAVEEMERRYELFAHAGVRDINRYNEKAQDAGQLSQKLPMMLIIIDELADLMMVAPGEVEEAICRIAQKARACGIHLILATQRPSVDVITGLIKANIPTRIAFSVSSQVDSRTIIDTAGAEKLLGRGDMLFAENGSSKTVRIQGTFVSDDEIDQVVQHVKWEQEPQYLFEQEELLKKTQIADEADELFLEACEFVVNQSVASASSLQRRFHIGYNRASRLIEMMETKGIISEARGSKPRDVLISEDELEYLQTTNTMV
ncbi:DNA translocase FtsK [Peribacillus kribbensis]|uniref:DNA translocase FtsK n=1 Tax=Peribacillus kribbensis TaxID=356658 RepID=UPI000401F948|nr:DNA translocase FtsK [Peribacillus kribbensis]